MKKRVSKTSVKRQHNPNDVFFSKRRHFFSLFLGETSLLFEKKSRTLLLLFEKKKACGVSSIRVVLTFC